MTKMKDGLFLIPGGIKRAFMWRHCDGKLNTRLLIEEPHKLMDFDIVARDKNSRARARKFLSLRWGSIFPIYLVLCESKNKKTEGDDMSILHNFIKI